MTAFTAAREALAALIDRIRAGENITATELATAQSAANAETELAALHAEGVSAREAEKLTRKQAAERATALATARELIADATDHANEVWDALERLQAETESVTDAYNEAVTTAIDLLKKAEVPGIYTSGGNWHIDDFEREIPHFDPRNYWDHYGNFGSSLVLDGIGRGVVRWDPRKRPSFATKA